MKTLKHNLLSITLLAALAIPALAGTPLASTSLVQLGFPGGTPCCGITTVPVTAFGGMYATLSGPLTTSFTGTWSAPVGAAWIGQFSGTGPNPDQNIGTSTWDFSQVGSANGNGFLPAGTFIQFGDLDNGSGTNERFWLTAYGPNGPIQGAWLDSPFFVSATNCSSSSSGDCVPQNMPEYSWGGPGSGFYSFDGADVPGNPTLTVWVSTNTDISSLTVRSFSVYDSFALAAPTSTPEPGSLLLLGSGVLGLGGFLRRRFLG